MTEYHSSESTLSEFEDVEDCDHTDYMVSVGDSMESGEIDGSYMKPFFCDHCNHFVYEEYSYEGVTVA